MIPQPFSNHNGGHLAFGPDGYLYIGLGDGGSGNDPGHRAQNPSTLLGKMLRIDVNVPDDHPNGYVVPADNPFLERHAGQCAAGDLVVRLAQPVALQLRSDPALGGTGALVDRATSARTTGRRSTTSRAGRGGRNYGWRNREGAQQNPNPARARFRPPTSR